MRDRIAFLHLPKSAGSSVRSAVTRAVGAHRVAPYQLDRTLFGSFDRFHEVDADARRVVLLESASEPSGLAPYHVALGHFALSTLTEVFEPGDVFVLLREPRARLVSHFSFWHGWTPGQHAVWAPYAGSRVPAARGWEGFLTDPTVAGQVDNLTLRLLLSPHEAIPADGFIDPAAIDTLALEAIDRLESLGHVDIIDRGAQFWDRLSTWLGVSLEQSHHNTTPPAGGEIDWAAAITPASERALADRTRGDRCVWDLVAARGAGGTDESRGDDLEVAALADAAYVRQIARVAANSSAPDPEQASPSQPPPPTPLPNQTREQAPTQRWVRAPRRLIDRVRGAPDTPPDA